jgi:two-component system chemotaxis sensor kinase CheA
MEIRLVPVRVLYDKLSRIVRKIAADEGRSVDLVLHGAETKLDKQIVEDISDPLMHLIRNAIDHGIELPKERIETGKLETGQIIISASQKGNRVFIEVADDGRGIDLFKVRRRAVERGLVSHPDDLTDQEAIDLIFEPGFSTSEVVSELSGRGVGMDVVKNNITALSGTVAVETRPGQGSRVSITLPITLAIIRTLIIDAGVETYGVPVAAVQETVPVAPGDILTLEGNQVLPVRDLLLPVVCLDRFFGGSAVSARESTGFAVVAGVASRRVGIMVDGIRGQQDLVLKSLGELLGEVRGIAGAADLGEGKTILVLDVAGIIDELYRGGGLVP